VPHKFLAVFGIVGEREAVFAVRAAAFDEELDGWRKWRFFRMEEGLGKGGEIGGGGTEGSGPGEGFEVPAGDCFVIEVGWGEALFLLGI